MAVLGHESHDERIAQLTSELAKRPDDSELHFLLARADIEHGDWELALPILEKVEQLAPGRFATGTSRGEALMLGNKFPEAKAAFDTWMAAHPEDLRAQLFRARANAALKDTNASLSDFREVLRRMPQAEPDLVHEVAEALASAGATDEAISVLDAAIRRLGNIPSLLLSALDLEVASGHFDQALARVDAMQLSAPRPEPWMAKRAELLEQAGRKAEARAAWESLATRLAALPNLERGSHAMSILAERANQGLRRIEKS